LTYFYIEILEHWDISTAWLLLPQKSSSFLLYIITLIITFITTLTILLSASHVHEIGILARQLDESIVMKLMMMSSKKGMRRVIHRERIGVAASTIGSALHRSGIQMAQERRQHG
jgi:hypothetical protein